MTTLQFMEFAGNVLMAFSLLPAGLMMLFMTTRTMEAEAIWIKPFLLWVGAGCLFIGLNIVLPHFIQDQWFVSTMTFLTGVVCISGMICIAMYRREILSHFKAGPSTLFGKPVGGSYYHPRKSDCEKCLDITKPYQEKIIQDMTNGKRTRKRG